jgi:hypothetical protein
MLTPAADERCARLCDLLGMYTTAPTAWSASLVRPILAPGTESVSVMVRVDYNTLEGIVNDHFVVTASISR